MSGDCLFGKQKQGEGMDVKDIKEFLIPQKEFRSQNINDLQFIEQVAIKQQFLIDNGLVDLQKVFGYMDRSKLDQIFIDLHKQKNQQQLDRRFNQDVFRNAVKSQQIQTDDLKPKDYKQKLMLKIKQTSKYQKFSYPKQSLQKMIQFTQKKHQLSERIKNKDSRQNSENKENINIQNCFESSSELTKHKKGSIKCGSIELNKQGIIGISSRNSSQQNQKLQGSSGTKTKSSYDNPFKNQKVVVFENSVQQFNVNNRFKSEKKRSQKNVFSEGIFSSGQKDYKSSVIQESADKKVGFRFRNCRQQFNI